MTIEPTDDQRRAARSIVDGPFCTVEAIANLLAEREAKLTDTLLNLHSALVKIRDGNHEHSVTSEHDIAADALLLIEDINAEAIDRRKQRLLQLMLDASEDVWCAGWMQGIEFDLWALATGEATEDTRAHYSSVARSDLNEMLHLSGLVDGWWIWRDGETFVSLDEWRTIMKAREVTT
jgi:hypothetical protein